jgi:hypothetical protein
MFGGPSDLDGDVHAGGKIKLLELINRFGRGFHNVEKPLVGADFKLVHRLLVDVRGAVHGETLNPSGEWDRAGNLGASALCCFDDLPRRLIQHAVIKGLKADSDALSGHNTVCLSWLTDVGRLALALLVENGSFNILWNLFKVRRLHRVT